MAAERSVPAAVALVVIERDGRHALAIDVLPDVQLGPVQQRMDPDVGARRELGLVLVPELRRLLRHVPFVAGIARREVALLRSAALLIGANAGIGISLGDDCVVEAGCYVTAGAKLTGPDGAVVKAAALSGQSNLLFRRNSLTGALEAVSRDRTGIELNATLHANT